MNFRTIRTVATLLVSCILPLTAIAQTDSTKKADSVAASHWKHQLVASAALSQVSFTNWAAGGEDALSYVINAEGLSLQTLEKTEWATSYRFAFGQARLSKQGLRKTDDKIDIETKLVYKVGLLVNPYAALDLKTQFTTGYTYDDSGKATAVSDFLDPLYAVQSVGLAYQPMKEFRTRLGLGLQEVFVKNYTLYTDDPSTPGQEKSQVHGGLQWVTEAEIPIDSNVLFKAKLEMFAPFKQLDVIEVRSDNSLIAKISKYFSANINVQFINDANVSPHTQIKEALALGISYAVF